jgi:hypothetical protein
MNLGSIAKLRKATISGVMSVRMKQLGSHIGWIFIKFGIWGFFRYLSPTFHKKSYTRSGYFTRTPMHIYDIFLNSSCNEKCTLYVYCLSLFVICYMSFPSFRQLDIRNSICRQIVANEAYFLMYTLDAFCISDLCWRCLNYCWGLSLLCFNLQNCITAFNIVSLLWSLILGWIHFVCFESSFVVLKLIADVIISIFKAAEGVVTVLHSQ